MSTYKYIFPILTASFLISSPLFAHEKPKQNDDFYFNPLRWMPISMHSQIYQLDQRPNVVVANKKSPDQLIHLGDRIAINGGVVIQGDFSDKSNITSFIPPSSNALNLRTAYFGFTGYMTSWARAFVSLNYEPGSVSTATGEPFTAPEMEQAYIQMQNQNRHFRFDLGKQYLPFSVYEHYPLIASLPQRLSEINKVAAVATINYHPFFASAYAFSMQGKLNGFNANPAENQLANGGVEMGFHRQNKKWGYEATVGYMNNMAETRFIYGLIKATHKSVGALSLHFNCNAGRFGFISNVIYAAQKFSPLDITYDDTGARPAAYAAKINYVIEVHRHPLVPMLAYEYSSQALFLSLAHYNYALSLEYWINKYLSTTAEYVRAKNYAAGNTGTYATSATTFTTISGNGAWNNAGVVELAAHF